MKKKINTIGFTLMELMCVLVILALLALLAGRAIIKSLNTAKGDLDESKKKAILNAAEKWSLNNLGKFDDEEGEVVQVGLDIVFVVDVSGGMKNPMPGDSKTSKSQAAVNAVIEVLNIFKEGDLNRVGFVFFGGKADLATRNYGRDYDMDVIPLTDIKNVLLDKELKKVNQNDVYSYATIRVDGEPKKVFFDKATNTLGGIQHATNLLLGADDKTGRVPVIIFLTDGEPSSGIGLRLLDRYDFNTNTVGDWGAGGTTWCMGGTTWDKLDKLGKQNLNDLAPYCYNTIPSELQANTKENRETITKNSARMYWNVINVASGAKEKIAEAYGSTMYFYTIGVGLNNPLAKFTVDPSDSKLAELPSTDIVNKYTVGSEDYYDHLWHTEIAQQLYKDITTDPSKKDYNYPTEAFTEDNISTERLIEIFRSIAFKLKDATKVSEVCVTIDELQQDGYLSQKVDLKGLNVTDSYVLVAYNEATNQFSYAIAETDKQIAKCKSYYKGK